MKLKMFLALMPFLLIGAVYVPGSKVVWDPVTLDVNGKPETVVEAEVGLFLKGTATPLITEKGVDPSGTGWELNNIVEALPGDGIYEVRVRVYDHGGNVSEWCDPAELVVDKTPPVKPTGCKILR